MKIRFWEENYVLKNKIYSKIVIYSKIGGAYTAPFLLPIQIPPAAKFASQGDAHVRSDTQMKFLYYPLPHQGSIELL